VTLAVFVLLGLTFAVYVWSEKQIDRAYQLRERSFLLAQELRQSSNDLTRMVRTYVVTADPVYKEHYQSILDIRDGRKPRPDGYAGIYWDLVVANGPLPHVRGERAIALLELMRQAGFTEQEFDKLKEAKVVSDVLTATEFEAIRLAESSGPSAANDHQKARAILHDPAYHQAKAAIMRPIDEFSHRVGERTLSQVQSAKTLAMIVRLVFIAFGISLLIALFRVNRFLQATIGGSVDQVYEHLRRIGSGDFSTQTPAPTDMSDTILGWLAETRTKLGQADQERQKAEEIHLENESRMDAIINTSLDSVIEMNAQGCVTNWNTRAESVFGWRKEEALGRSLHNMIIPKRHRAAHQRGLARYLATGEIVLLKRRIEVTALRRNGEEFPIEMAIVPIGVGKELRFASFISDITERKQMLEQMHQLAFYDALTKLPNRRLLNDRLNQVMAASRRSGRYCALIFLDLDNFKKLNDAHGHAMGDLLLIEAAQRLIACVREVDTVARFGGDEFVVLLGELDLDQTESMRQARIVTEKIRTSMAAPYQLTMTQPGLPNSSVEHQCSASIGAVLFGNQEVSQADVLKRGDMAMYRAKEEGSNLIRFHEENNKS